MRALLIILTLILFASSSMGDDGTTQAQLLAIDSAFVRGDYSEVELLTLRLLQSNAELTLQERSRVNLTAGYALIMQDRENEARECFRRALDAEPNLMLDPVQVSPKFRVVFDEVKSNYQNGKLASTSTTLSEPVGPSRKALLANLILPGSGQWLEGRRFRGGIVFLAQAAAVGVLIWRIDEMRDAHADYLAQTDPRLISARYDDYNNDYALAWSAGALVGAVYLAAQTDLLLYRDNAKEIGFLPFTDSGQGITLNVRW